ncbi:MAG: Hint domain-containing protein [Euryarchaeota archaeon]|nr:Hint domain-containing protein [Euryarchaeota archaeon]
MRKYRGIWSIVLTFLLLALSVGVFLNGNASAASTKQLDWGYGYHLPKADNGATYGSGVGSYDVNTGYASMSATSGHSQNTYIYSSFKAASGFTGMAYCQLSGEYYGFTDCAFDNPFIGIGQAYVYIKVVVTTSTGGIVSELLIDWVTSGGQYNPGEHTISGSFQGYREWTAVPGTEYRVCAWVYGGASSPIHAHCNGWVHWTQLEVWCHVPPGFGGCVLEGTDILMADGSSLPVETLKKGDAIMGYETSTMTPVTEKVLSNKKSFVSQIEIINGGLLCLTPTNQPIYARNDVYTGWIINPCELEVGWYLFDPVNGQWVEITSIGYEVGRFTVYDIGATSPDNYVANGLLLDRKPVRG